MYICIYTCTHKHLLSSHSLAGKMQNLGGPELSEKKTVAIYWYLEIMHEELPKLKLAY